MITFIIALALLVAGFFTYGVLVEKIFGVEPERKTPALTKTDGVDFVPMAPWRIFLVQFLNIAGLGPIFGAIMGVFYGPAAFLWIVFGTIFAGGVHDYLSGMLSIRKGGVSLPDIVGDELGKGTKVFIRVLDKDRTLETLKGLKSAGGWLRRELGARLRLRCTPELVFTEDTSIGYGAHIADLLASLNIPKEEPENDDPGNG